MNRLTELDELIDEKRKTVLSVNNANIIEYIHKLPKWFGKYLGDEDTVKLCLSEGPYCFDKDYVQQVNNAAIGYIGAFRLMVRVPHGLDYNLIRLNLCIKTVYPDGGGDEKIIVMVQPGKTRLIRDVSEENMCQLLYQDLKDTIGRVQHSDNIRFVTTIKL